MVRRKSTSWIAIVASSSVSSPFARRARSRTRSATVTGAVERDERIPAASSEPNNAIFRSREPALAARRRRRSLLRAFGTRPRPWLSFGPCGRRASIWEFEMQSDAPTVPGPSSPRLPGQVQRHRARLVQNQPRQRQQQESRERAQEASCCNHRGVSDRPHRRPPLGIFSKTPSGGRVADGGARARLCRGRACAPSLAAPAAHAAASFFLLCLLSLSFVASAEGGVRTTKAGFRG